MTAPLLLLAVFLLAAPLLPLPTSAQPQSNECGPFAAPVPCGPPANNALPGPSSAAISKLQKYTNIVIIYFTANSYDFLMGAFPNSNNVQRAVSNGLYNPQITEVGYLGHSNTTYSCLPPDNQGYITASSLPYNLSSCIPNAPFEISPLIPINTTWVDDPKHTWWATQYNINGGLMNGFVWPSGNMGGLSMGYYNLTGSYLYALAANYTLFDSFFQSSFGGVMVNHLYLISAQIPTWNNLPAGSPACPTNITQCYGTSCTTTTNLYPSDWVDADGLYLPNNDGSLFTPDCHVVENVDPFTLGKSPNLPPITSNNIGDLLDTVGASWTWYFEAWNQTILSPVGSKTSAPVSLHETPFSYYAKFSDLTSAYTQQHIRDDSQFYTDIASNNLANVTWLKPSQLDGFGVTDNNPVAGQAKLQSYMQALQSSSYWANNQLLIIATFSDSDGLYDHVPPYIGDWSGPGTRVPAIVISPDHAGGYINSQPYETGSILKLIETRFGITDSLFSQARFNSTADLTKSFGDDALTHANAALDVGPLVNWTAAPVSAIIEQSYAACVHDIHSEAALPLMLTAGGEKLQSSALIVNVSSSRTKQAARKDVWRSYDGWKTAQPLGATIMADGSGPVMPRRASSAAMLNNGNIVWMAGKNGTAPVYTNFVSYSTDQGVTWRTATAAAPWVPRSDVAVCALPKTNTIVLAGGVGAVGGGSTGTSTFLDDVWMSSDGIGAVWTQVNTGDGVPYHGGSCVGLYDSVAVNPTLFSQACSTIFIVSSYATGNYRSFDCGATFETLPVPWPELSSGNGGGIADARIFMSLAVDYDNVLYVLGGSLHEVENDVWLSTNKGEAWNQLVTNNAPTDPNSPYYVETACLAVSYVTSGSSVLKQLVLYSGTIGFGLPNPSLPVIKPVDVYGNPAIGPLNPSNVQASAYALVMVNTANSNQANSAATPAYVPTLATTGGITVPAVPQLTTLGTGPATLAANTLPMNTAPSCAQDVNSRAATPRLVYCCGQSVTGSPSNAFFVSTTGFATSTVNTSTPATSAVTPVAGAGLVIIASGPTLLLLGGATGSSFSNQVAASTDAVNWVTVSNSGSSIWSARAGASVCTAPGSNLVFLIGGQSSAATANADAWTAAAGSYSSGLSWTQQSATGLGPVAFSAPCVAFNSSAVVVATSAGSLYRSLNGGSSFSFISSLPFGFMGPRTNFQMLADLDGLLWMTGGVSIADSTYSQGDVYLSRDGGVTWYVALPASVVAQTGAPRLASAINSCMGIVYSSSNAYGSSYVKQLVLYGGNITYTGIGGTFSATTLTVAAAIGAAPGSSAPVGSGANHRQCGWFHTTMLLLAIVAFLLVL